MIIFKLEMNFSLLRTIRNLSTSPVTCKNFIKHKDRVRNKISKLYISNNKYKYSDKVVKDKFVSSQSWFALSEKKLNPKVLLREKRVAGLLVKEIQDLIDSSIMNEISQLEVKVTEVVHRNKGNCIVLWKSNKALDRSETNTKLNMISGKLKHYLIQSNVLGQVPNFHFRIDENLIQSEEVDKILGDLQISKILNYEDVLTEVRITDACKAVVFLEESKGGKKNKKTEISQDLFNIDHIKLNEKIKLAKLTSKKIVN